VPNEGDITRLLARLSESDEDALHELLPLVQAELHCMAVAQMSQQPAEHTLQATALVNEAVLRLIRSGPRTWNDRAHFFRSVARTMRTLLVDHARAKKRAKRSGGSVRVPLDDVASKLETRAGDIEALNLALEKLARADPGAASLIELRYFLDLPMNIAAEVLGMPQRTAEREWTSARAWLRQELTRDA